MKKDKSSLGELIRAVYCPNQEILLRTIKEGLFLIGEAGDIAGKVESQGISFSDVEALMLC